MKRCIDCILKDDCDGVKDCVLKYTNNKKIIKDKKKIKRFKKDE